MLLPLSHASVAAALPLAVPLLSRLAKPALPLYQHDDNKAGSLLLSCHTKNFKTFLLFFGKTGYLLCVCSGGWCTGLPPSPTA